MNKAVFLDRDGTIIEDAHYLNDPAGIRFFPRVMRGLRKLSDRGFFLFIATNQSGIGRGYFTERQLCRIHQRLLSLLKKNGITIRKIYYAPYYEKSRIKKYRSGEFFRKPGPGMLFLAQKEFSVSLAHSYMIGDRDSDIGAAQRAGLRAAVLIRHPGNRAAGCLPDHTAPDFEKACDWILSREEASKVIACRSGLEERVRDLKKRKKSIVTTNGVFDILHIGHLRYLAGCRQYGDKLIVGVNADRSVKKIKGAQRPVNDHFSRAEILAGLECVDYVYIFPEKDPRDFLSVVRPAVHVKGGDYSPDRMIERPVVEKYRGRIVLLPLVAGRSTTDLIGKIRGLS